MFKPLEEKSIVEKSKLLKLVKITEYQKKNCKEF